MTVVIINASDQLHLVTPFTQTAAHTQHDTLCTSLINDDGYSEEGCRRHMEGLTPWLVVLVEKCCHPAGVIHSAGLPQHSLFNIISHHLFPSTFDVRSVALNFTSKTDELRCESSLRPD